MKKGGIADIGGVFLLICLVFSLIFGYIILKPFLMIFLIAFVLATLFYPLYNWFLKKTKNRPSLSSIFTCIVIVLIIIVPALAIIGILAQESILIYHKIEENIESGILDQPIIPKLKEIKNRYFPKLPIDFDSLEIGKDIASLIGKVSSYLVSFSASVIKNIASGVIQFFLMFFALYYFLKDGPAFLKWIMDISPLPHSFSREIFKRFRLVSESAFLGTFVSAIAQGVLGGIAFFIVGFPPIIWGVAMAFCSLLPFVGSAIVWIPGSIYLFIMGKTLSGIFLLIWGGVVIGLVDNILKPIIMRGKVELHPILTFFSILGGVMTFGLYGILLGPLAISMAVAFLQAYASEAKETLNEFKKK
jgi:predicted PurR-regulated permease PerM